MSGKSEKLWLTGGLTSTDIAALFAALAPLRRCKAYSSAVGPLINWGAAASALAFLMVFVFAPAAEPHHARAPCEAFERHRLLGLGAAVLVWSYIGMAELNPMGERPGRGSTYHAYRAALFLGTLILAVAAHHGGLLVYGMNYSFLTDSGGSL